MADNAPFSVNRPPFPNVKVNFDGRVEVHVATISLTGATAPALVSGSSTPGIAIADTATGRVGITFPPGGTGAIGWTLVSLFSAATPSPLIGFSLDSDLTNYATGVLELSHFATDADTTADDVTGEVTVVIHVLKAMV